MTRCQLPGLPLSKTDHELVRSPKEGLDRLAFDYCTKYTILCNASKLALPQYLSEDGCRQDGSVSSPVRWPIKEHKKRKKNQNSANFGVTAGSGNGWAGLW